MLENIGSFDIMKYVNSILAVIIKYAKMPLEWYHSLPPKVQITITITIFTILTLMAIWFAYYIIRNRKAYLYVDYRE